MKGVEEFTGCGRQGAAFPTFVGSSGGEEKEDGKKKYTCKKIVKL